MDLLFKRYASPYSILDEMIACNRLPEFINELLEIKKEEDEGDQDKLLWHFWLHNVENETFSEWKERNNEVKEMQEDELEATVENSRDILNGFNPE